MPNDVEISSLFIDIEAASNGADKSIDAVASALARLNANSKITATANRLTKLSSSLRSLQGLNSVGNVLTKVSVAVQKLSSVQKLSGLNSALNTLAKIPTVVSAVDPSRVAALSAAVAPLNDIAASLGTIGKPSGLQSTLTALRKIPKITAELEAADMGKFAAQMQQVKAAVAPLASEIEKVSRGFSLLPDRVQRAINANAKLASSNKNVSNSFSILGLSIPKTTAAWLGYFYVLERAADFMGKALTSFNEYVENVNLFSVSMGEFTQQAASFAQSMQDILGVDASGAMRNMGIIQNLVTSFGVASDQAYVLSKNITQLGYDFASFFNIGTEDAFTKLQAAISGELEPIRRLGVDISEARLQQELYNLGIDASVKSLSQADKSLLRYIAIMNQTGNAQTDMARTLNSPANMMRVFNQQVTLLVRSLGSLLIPMLNALLPPLIAVVQILREFASSVASFMGVTVDFSEAGKQTASSVGGISGELEDVSESAAGAKKELDFLIGGFDELNVMSKDTSAPDVSGGTSGGDLLGGIELPEYDMFEGLVESRVDAMVESIKDAFKDLGDFLRPFMPTIKGIGAALAGMFVVSKVKSFAKAIGLLGGTKKGIGLLSQAMLSFNSAFENGLGITKSMGQVLKDFRSGLSLTTKVMAGTGGFIAVFATAYSAIKDWELGVISGGEAAANLTVAVVAVGAVLTAMLGPVGLLITGIGALTGAIFGNAAAVREQNMAMFENALMNGKGVPIEAVVEDVVQFNDALLQTTDSIRQNSSALEENKQTISLAGDQIMSFKAYMELASGDVANNYVPQIKQSFDDLYNSIKSNMEMIQFALLGALASTPQEIIDQLDADIPHLAGLVMEATGQITAEAEELQKQFQEVYSQWEQNPSEELRLDLLDLAEQMYGLSGEGTKQVEIFNQKLEDLGDIDLSDSQAVKKALEDLGTSATNAVQGFEEARTGIQNMLDELSAVMSKEDRDTLQSFFEESFTLEQEQVLAKTEEAVKNITESYDKMSDEISKNAKPNWYEMGQAIVGELWRGSLDFDSAAQQTASYNLKRDLENQFNSIVNDTMGPVREKAKELGLSVASGYSGGVSDNSYMAEDSVTDMVNDGIDAAAAAQDSHSPSKVYNTLGTYAPMGYANGVRSKFSLVTGALSSMANTGISEFRSSLQMSGGISITFQSIGASLPESVANGIRSGYGSIDAAIQELGNRMAAQLQGIIAGMQSMTAGISFSGMSMSGRMGGVPALASGGVLTGPRVILAGEYPGASSNPEIVAPQSIMRKTVSEANVDMAAAIVAAIRQLEQTIIEESRSRQKVTVDIDADSMYHSNQVVGSRQGYPVGMNPHFN